MKEKLASGGAVTSSFAKYRWVFLVATIFFWGSLITRHTEIINIQGHGVCGFCTAPQY